ncbi:mmge/prpd [Lucifera butyrica]|uniref:Mmge/prpd n=1 Tax=Lucifera butyrica TaxID=1351585 RepID=A0A498R6X6_9FIRM|nr:MmgE/PrpD family protein [Lucifera butyrica]VBB07111.1 mmge/prpd [Lucifera butyrica]
MNSQEKIANFIEKMEDISIPEEILHDIKYRVVDWLGCAVIGKSYPQSHIAGQFVEECNQQEEVLVIGSKEKVSLLDGIFLNGIMGHVAELDDGHRVAIGHPGSVTVPVALGFGERYGCSEMDFLKAVLVGYEVFIRLGCVVNPSHYHYWHTTGTCGTFAAAATAAYLLKLNHKQIVNALGIAGTMASGLQQTFGTYAKSLNIGQACRNGGLAALLAQRGFTGPADIIMGPKGFVRATSVDATEEPLNEINQMRFLANTAFYKIYASCGHTNSPLDAVFHILNNRRIIAEEVRKISVETYKTSVEITGRLACETEDQAKFSLPYCIAIAILYGKVSLNEFKPEILHSKEVLALAEKVSVAESPAATAAFPERQAKVSIYLTNGECICKEILHSNDTPDYNQIESKFLEAIRYSGYGETFAKSFLTTILALDHEDSLDNLQDPIRRI